MPKSTPSPKGFKLSPKGEKGFAKAERNKMKVYGDVPDSRPKGRVMTPEGAAALKKLRARKGTMT